MLIGPWNKSDISLDECKLINPEIPITVSKCLCPQAAYIIQDFVKNKTCSNFDDDEPLKCS